MIKEIKQFDLGDVVYHDGMDKLCIFKSSHFLLGYSCSIVEYDVNTTISNAIVLFENLTLISKGDFA